jgi:ssDNA-binding Zn-finger/Zn-ribbon topoisomerase 1
VDFAYTLLTKAHQQMNAARAEAHLSTLPLPWSEVAGGQECLTCHRGIESQRGTFAGRSFSHAPHLGGARLACQACHRTHAERAPGEVVRFAANGCTTCHHSEKQAPVTAATCQTCHGNIRTKVFPSTRGAFTHAPHLDNGVECSTCHTMRRGDPHPDATVCASCHEGG